jgi:mannose-6-phosphate isomerase-like protein (cupin superfamily)
MRSAPVSESEAHGREASPYGPPRLSGEIIFKSLPAYPRMATFENPARNSDRTSCPSLTRSQQRTRSKALTEKEATLNIVADTRTYADILQDIPAFSRCTQDALDHFVTERAFTMHTGAGREICSRADMSRNLYVIVAGSAVLDAGDVRVALEPGDYFGGDSPHHHELAASVIAEEDAEVLVISPEEVARLQRAASRRHHPSNADWIPESATPGLRLVRSRRRMAVLEPSAS